METESISPVRTCHAAVFSADWCKNNVFPPPVLEAAAQHAQILWPDLSAGAVAGNEDLAQAEVILGTWGMPRLTAEFLDAMPNLKAVFYAAGTVKPFVTEESWARGIMICSAAEANAIPVAEFTFATIILSLKQLWHHANKARAGHWGKDRRVAGSYRSKVGLVSLGSIARRVTQLLRHTEVDLLVYDPYCPAEVAAEHGAKLVTLEELFTESDVVSVHAPWTPETEGMIHCGLFERMRPGATLINTARGAVINETDLCAVLGRRRDLTAVLDVTHPEPPAPDSPLFRLENVVLSPHIAGSQDGECARLAMWMVEELRRYLHGEPLRHCITREMLERMA